MKVGSLFSGGGLGDLGFMMAGMEIAFQVEIEDYCQKILKLRWPDVPKWRDIKDVRGSELPAVDIITGGFPCQSFSVAGQRRGKEDVRWLWPEMFRIICEVGPRWVVGENVPGIIGLALDDVLSDLESEGYETTTLVFPAHVVPPQVPHRRERVWIIAKSRSERTGMEEHRSGGQTRESTDASESKVLRQKDGEIGSKGIASSRADVAHSEIQRTRDVSKDKREVCGKINPPHDPSGFIGGDDRAEGDALAHTRRQHGEREEITGEHGRTDQAGNASEPERPVERDRVGVVADADKFHDDLGRYGASEILRERQEASGLQDREQDASHADRAGRQEQRRAESGEEKYSALEFSGWREAESGICRVVNVSPNRVGRLKMLGNGQVCSVTAWIGRRILEHDRKKSEVSQGDG